MAPPSHPHCYLIPLSALLLLAHLSPALCTCRQGSKDECMDAPFVPGHDLVGEGFDIVKMQRKRAYTIDVQTYLGSDNTCQICENDEMDNELQKLPLSVVDWRSNSKCVRLLQSGIYNSAKELAQSTGSQIKNDWKVGLGLEKFGVGAEVGLGMGRSNMARFASKKSKEDYYTFIHHEFNCTYYSFRVSSTASPSREFTSDISRLPREYNDKTCRRYKQLINTYGTHYLGQVELGGRMKTVSAIRTCLSSLNSHSAHQIEDCLSAQLSLTLGLPLSINLKAEQCSSMLKSDQMKVTSDYAYIQQVTELTPGDVWIGSLSASFNDSAGFDVWFDNLKEDPGVVSYSLNPLTMLITDEVIKGNVKTAIQEYLKDNPIPPISNDLTCKSGNCCPKELNRAKLQIALKATGLYGDWFGETEAFAEVQYGVVMKQTEEVESNDPVWKELDFGNVHTGTLLTVTVKDRDWWGFETLGSCSFRLTKGSHTEIRHLRYGSVTLSYTLTCDSHLTGDLCDAYDPR